MELTYDWRGFQGLFYPQRRSSAPHASLAQGPIYLITDHESVVTAFADGEDLAEWSGATVSDIRDRFSNREFIHFDRPAVDKWIEESLALPHFYEQVEFLRARARSGASNVAIAEGTSLVISRGNSLSKLKKLERDPSAKPKKAPKNSKEHNFPSVLAAKHGFKRHFLLSALQTWWSKVLPASYGIFIRIEGHPEQELLLVVRRNSFAGFHEPDLNTLGADKRKQSHEVVKYLSDRYLVPVQGVFVTAAEWENWIQTPKPWKDVAKAIKGHRARLVPFRWGVSALVAARAYLSM